MKSYYYEWSKAVVSEAHYVINFINCSMCEENARFICGITNRLCISSILIRVEFADSETRLVCDHAHFLNHCYWDHLSLIGLVFLGLDPFNALVKRALLTWFVYYGYNFAKSSSLCLYFSLNNFLSLSILPCTWSSFIGFLRTGSSLTGHLP